MTINRKFWLEHFLKNNFPNWNCPRCNAGVLRPVDNSFHYWESADSHEFGRKFLLENNQRIDDNALLGMEASDYRYSVLLKCNKCGESIASCGSGYVIQDFIPELKDTDFFDIFIPEYFYPTINIFPLSGKFPEEVTKEIRSSFKLFFADPPAAANYVRKAVDAILSSKKIKKTVVNNKGKRVLVNLHDRIVEFKKSEPEIAEKLLAIKWLGNEGSHTDKMTKNDVLDAYEILELVLDDLYVGNRKMVEKKVARINKSKKPLHPST